MIRISYWPVRFEANNVTKTELPWEPGKTVQQYLDEAAAPNDGHTVIHQGSVLKDFTGTLRDGEELIVTPTVEAPVIAAIIAVVVFIATHIVTILIIGLTIYAVYSAVTARQRMPSFGNAPMPGGADESSPTYGWDGIQTVAEVGIPVKIIYGRHRTGGNIINQYLETDGDKQYLNLLIGIGEGEIESIAEIKLNDNPIENYDGIATATRLGTNAQSVIPNFQDLHDVRDVNQALTQSNAVVYTTVGSEVEAFQIILSLPQGLFQINGANGDVQSWDVTYLVEYKEHSAGSYTSLGSTTISARNRTAIRRSFTKTGLTPGQYDIRVTRTSADSSLEPQMNGDLYLASVDEIRTDDLAYPNTALLSIRALATDQLSGAVPNVTMLVEGVKIRCPAVKTSPTGADVAWEDYYYDPGAEEFRRFSDDASLYWDESTYRTEWCANPVWCMRDLQLNTRYGLGQFIQEANLNDARILETALFCEHRVPNGAGGYEKRYRMDVVLDSPTKTPDLLQQLSAVFDAFAFYSQGGFQFSIDRATDPVQVFGMANICENSFAQQWKSKTDVYNVISVQFMNEDIDYQQDEVAITDEVSLAAGDPVREKKLRVFVTKMSYALRLARRQLWVSKYINRTVSFRAFIDAIVCQAGDRIEVSHDVPQWGYSGRVQTGSTNTVIQLGKEIELAPATTYAILVRDEDDTIQQKNITTPAGLVSAVTLNSALTGTPATFSVWAIGPVTQIAKPFRVIGMSRQGNGEIEISALEYNESIFDDSAPVLPTNNYSLLTREIKAVQNLALTERVVLLRDFQIENAIDVWFNRPDISGNHVVSFARARVYTSDNDGASWDFRGETTTDSFTVIGNILSNRTYKVAVTSVGANGQETAIANSPQEEITVIGKAAAPSDVATFIAIQSRDRLIFGWTPVTDLDVVGYEIRKGVSFDLGDTVVFVAGRGRGSIALDIREGVDQSYWIKARDADGNYSSTALESVLSIEQVPFTNIIEAYEEATTWTGTKVNTAANTAGSLLLTSSNLTGTYETGVVDVGFLAPFKIGVAAVVTNAGSDEEFDDSLTEEFDDSETKRFSGEEIAGAATFEVKTSEDNVTWSAYAPWFAGDYFCRYFQIKMTLTRANTAVQLECSSFSYFADLPDVDEYGDATVASGDVGTGIEIVYAKTYHQVPSVQITAKGTTPLVPVYGTDPDLTDVKIRLFDVAGNEVTGSFKYHIHGV